MTLPEIDHVSFLVEHAQTFFAGEGLAWVSGLPEGIEERRFLMGEGVGGEEQALSLFRFHLSPFPPETPDTQAIEGLSHTKWFEEQPLKINEYQSSVTKLSEKKQK